MVRTGGAILGAGVLGVAVMVPLVGSAGATAKKTNQTVRIVLGGSLTFTDASVYKAIQNLDASHIAVSLSVITDPSSALDAVVSGKADIYLGDPVEAAAAVANGQAPIKYIATVDQTSAYEILALPKYNLSNLSGASIGSAGPGTAGIIIADAALARKGVNISALHTVTVGGTTARVTALLAGEIDLAPAISPAAVAAVATGKVKILLNTGRVLGKYLQSGLIASDSYMKSHRSTVQTVVNAFLNSQKWSAKQESRYIALADAHKLSTTMTPQEQQAAWRQLVNGRFFSTTGAICAAAVAVTEQYTYETATSALKKTNTPKYGAWVQASFVRQYLKDHHMPRTSC